MLQAQIDLDGLIKISNNWVWLRIGVFADTWSTWYVEDHEKGGTQLGRKEFAKFWSSVLTFCEAWHRAKFSYSEFEMLKIR